MRHPISSQTIMVACIGALCASLLRCSIPVVTSDPAEMPYRTEHFRIYYDSTVIGRGEIEEIGLLKERMLVHVNNYFGTSFDHPITTIITDSINLSHMDWKGLRTHERVSYARFDNGHETAHVVSIHEWQCSDLDFLVEGFAVAAQFHRSGDPIDDLVWLVSFAVESPEERVSAAMNTIAHNIEHQQFEYTYEQYVLAGAFVHYMRMTFDLTKLTDWWIRTTIPSRKPDVEIFWDVFGISHTDAISGFARTVRSRLTVR